MTQIACWPEHKDCLHREYIGKAVTLNGDPAKITMNDDGYAMVSPLDPNKGAVPYSWTGVWTICDLHGGKFGDYYG